MHRLQQFQFFLPGKVLSTGRRRRVGDFLLGSLRNHEGYAEDWQRRQKKNFYFTYESRDNLESFTLFITVKTIKKLIPEHSVKFEKEKRKLAVVVHVLQPTPNLVIWRRCFAEDSKEMYHELQRTCTVIVLLIKTFVLWRSCCRCPHGFVNFLWTYWSRAQMGRMAELKQ